MLRFNTFRARRYLRTKFVEGKFLLASEASDLELEILDLLRTSVRSTMGDVAIADAWKVERQSDTTVLIKPGEAWFRGLPFMLRSGKDQLVSGAILTLGTVPVGVSAADDPSGLGKVITFNDSTTTPTNDYRFVITAREELVTDIDDPFLKNANLAESTGQKVRLNFRLNIVPVSSQTESPIPYRDENSTSGGPVTNFPDAGGTASPNFVNKISVSPSAAGNGELISLTPVTGSEAIDGRDLEIVVRNDPGLGGGNPIPNSPSEQQSFANGKLIDSVGTEYHLNAIFNDTISTQVVLRIDKEPDQPNPEIINGSDYVIKKRDVYATDDINGNPQGFIHWVIADLVWDSTKLISHQSKITDLRVSIEEKDVFQNKTNIKDNLILAEGGDVAFDATSGLLSWSDQFKIKHPFGTDNTIATGSANMLAEASLVYDMDLDSGGAIEKGTTVINVTTGGTTITIDPITYTDVSVGNVIVDSAGDLASITSIDPDTNQLTVSATLATGAGTIFKDQYAAGTAPLTSNAFHLATRSADRIYFYRGLLELEDGETSQIGDGLSSQILTYMGATGESDSDPNYSSTVNITQGDSLTVAIGKLDAATAGVSATTDEDRNLKMIAGGTWFWDLATETLSWSASAFVQRPGFVDDRNEISAGSIVLNANEVAYVDINRSTDSATVLPVSKATIGALTLTSDRVIIARRDASDVVVGTSSFRLKDGERLELDGALAEINRLLGQLKLTAHESDADKARIAGADASLLDGNTLSQELNDFFLSFDGAVIDFTTGEVFESDGSTPLGIDFTPQTIPVGEYFWYGIALLPGSITADNRQQAQVQITLASASNAVQASAPLPLIIGDKKLGAIQVVNNAGSIELADIRRLGTGSGSGGGGTGDANSFIETLKNRLLDSTFELVTPMISSQDEDDLLDGSSTAAYDPASKNIKFASASDELVTVQMLDPSYLTEGRGVSKVELMVQWDDTAQDNGATYEVSRNGGNEYQAVTMERILETDTYRGIHTFADEAANQNILSQTTKNGTQELDTSTNQELGQELTIANATEIREASLSFVINGSPSGKIVVSLREDDTGLPGDVIAETAAIDVSSLSAGDNTIVLPRTVVAAGTYHLTVRTDQDYKDNFVTSTTSLELDTDTAGTDGSTNNGTSWSAGAFDLAHTIDGIELDLRVKITSSASDVELKGLGIFYAQPVGLLATQEKALEVVHFQAVADNLNEFTIGQFMPNPDILNVYYVQAGQVYRNGAFSLDGQKVIFPVDQFNNGGVEAPVTLVFDQTRGGAFDNSDANALLLAGNHLGSTDVTIDKSANGEGIFLRRPDGTLREITIDNNDQIVIYSV